MNLYNIFTQIPSSIFWKDMNSRFLGCNQYLAEHAGLDSPGDIIGKCDNQLIWADRAHLYIQEDEEVLSGNPKRNIIQLQTRDNNQQAKILMTKAPLKDEAGNIIGVIGNYTDILEKQFCGAPLPGKINIPVTPRQIDCLVRLVRGLTAKQIAEELSISRRTVEHHLEHLKHSFGCHTKSALIKMALSFDLILKALMHD